MSTQVFFIEINKKCAVLVNSYQYYNTSAGVQCPYGAHCACNFDFTVALSVTNIETYPSVFNSAWK
jgi:hypothetical protein